MRLLPLLVLLFPCLTLAADRRSDSARLVVMTLNAEFLWDGRAPEEGQVKFAHKGDLIAAQAHMRDIAQIIRRANPDLVNLVEVENIQALETLNQDYLQGLGYRAYLIDGQDTYTGQDVGLLTRIDPIVPLSREDRLGCSGTVDKSVSKNYIAKFQIGQLKLALVGLHLLAIPLDEQRRAQRQAQADAIHQATLDLQAEGFELVVLGDFNDFDGQVRDHEDNLPISKVLEQIKSLKPDDRSDDLINVAEHVAKRERFTSFYDRNQNGVVDGPQEFSSIDHILISPKLAKRISAVSIDQSYDPAGVSDHFPIIASLKLDQSKRQPGKLRISAVLPDPDGDDRQLEWVRLSNDSEKKVDLSGWTLSNDQGKTWKLDDQKAIEPGENRTVQRQGQSMGLRNQGDTVSLIDPKGETVDQIHYAAVRKGQQLEF